MIQKSDLEQRQKASEDVDTAKANELALRELLKSVREAKYVISSFPPQVKLTKCAHEQN